MLPAEHSAGGELNSFPPTGRETCFLNYTRRTEGKYHECDLEDGGLG